MAARLIRGAGEASRLAGSLASGIQVVNKIDKYNPCQAAFRASVAAAGNVGGKVGEAIVQYAPSMKQPHRGKTGSRGVEALQATQKKRHVRNAKGAGARGAGGSGGGEKITRENSKLTGRLQEWEQGEREAAKYWVRRDRFVKQLHPDNYTGKSHDFDVTLDEIGTGLWRVEVYTPVSGTKLNTILTTARDKMTQQKPRYLQIELSYNRALREDVATLERIRRVAEQFGSGEVIFTNDGEHVWPPGGDPTGGALVP